MWACLRSRSNPRTFHSSNKIMHFFLKARKIDILLGTNKLLRFYRVLAITIYCIEYYCTTKKVRFKFILYTICPTHWTERQFAPGGKHILWKMRQRLLLRTSCWLLLILVWANRFPSKANVAPNFRESMNGNRFDVSFVFRICCARI